MKNSEGIVLNEVPQEVGVGPMMQIKDDILIITINLKNEHGPSSTGKTTVIASTKGNVQVAPGVYLGINCYKYADKKS